MNPQFLCAELTARRESSPLVVYIITCTTRSSIPLEILGKHYLRPSHMNNDGVDGSMVRRHGEPPHATIEVEERLVVLMSKR